MNTIKNEWTPLLKNLAAKVDSQSRRILMGRLIGEVYDSCLSNFSGEGGSGDMRPWNDELLISQPYRRAVGRDFATLELDGAERERLGRDGPHLKDCFVFSFDEKGAVLENTSEYASNHQLGEGVPRRPFFPVDENEQLMPFMFQRFQDVMDDHFNIK